nr:MAG TPA: hypothetical protein [Caudoviricetes sp.]
MSILYHVPNHACHRHNNMNMYKKHIYIFYSS